MNQERAVLAGGCFWGMQELLRHRDGVLRTRVGYTGGSNAHATYRNHDGHAEAVEVIFDPARLTYRQILELFFQIHDPTTRNRQGNDVGTSYRSAIFYANEEQKRVAEAYIKQLSDAKVFSHPIVTKLTPLSGFFAAEAYHQDFIAHNPDYPYVVYNDLPKLRQLELQFPELVARK